MAQKMSLRRKPGRRGSPCVSASSQGCHSYVTSPGPITVPSHIYLGFVVVFGASKYGTIANKKSLGIGCN